MTTRITHHDILRQLKRDYGRTAGVAGSALRAKAISDQLHDADFVAAHPEWDAATVRLAIESIERQANIWLGMMQDN